MKTPVISIVAVAFALAVVRTTTHANRVDPSLTIGVEAPALENSIWIAGRTVEKFEAHGICAVVFGSTWSLPFEKEIPHMLKLEREVQGKASFVFVACEKDKLPRLPSLNRLLDGRKAGGTYSVAIHDSTGHACPHPYLEAAELEGIPRAFIIRSGTVAWIGHPQDLDGVLRQAIDGTLDREAALAHHKHQIEANRLENEAQAVREEFTRIFEKRDFEILLERVNQLIVKNGNREAWAWEWKLLALFHLREEVAIAYADSLISRNGFWSTYAQRTGRAIDRRTGRIAIGEMIANSDELPAGACAYGRNRLNEALDGAGKDFYGWTLLAKTNFRLGDIDLAIRAQNSALFASYLIEGVEAETRANLEAVLDKYYYARKPRLILGVDTQLELETRQGQQD